MYNSTNNPYNAYKNNAVKMASKEQLLLMLVDGAVKYTKVARLAIEKGELQRAHTELIRVQDIFTELMSTLDRSFGEGAESLFNLYDFIKNRLAQANIKKSIEIIDEVLPIIEDVRDTWYEVSKKARGV